MRRAFLALAAVGMGVTMFAGPAGAARPNNRACLGVDASSAAQVLRPSGQIISAIATSGPQSIGGEVQLHLAGEVPDSAFPNSCNDD